MNLAFAWTVALRELRGGLAGFRVFLACLILGVMGIAAVGSVTTAIERGLAEEGRTILGGDVSIEWAYRGPTDEERAWMEARGEISEIVELRSLLRSGDERALVEVKAVDGPYPLYGTASLTNGAILHDALEGRGLPGLVTERVLAERMGLEPGDQVRLGAGLFNFEGVIAEEPDRASGGFAMGPRVMTSVEGLRAAGLLVPGVVYETEVRIRTPEDMALDAMEDSFQDAFPEAGARWSDRRAAAPGISRFVDRLSSFLTIVGIAALAVGGVGIGSAVRGYLTRKVPVIAALRTLGATASTVFAAYMIQVGIIAVVGVAIGVAVGGGLVAGLGPMLAGTLAIPAKFGLYAAPLAEAALFGVLAAALFTLWPLAWLLQVRPAELFRGDGADSGTRPARGVLIAVAGLALALVGSILLLSATPILAAWCLGAIGVAFVALRALGWVAARLARRLSHGTIARKRPGLRLALGAIGAPQAGTPGVVLALGLGLGVLAAIAQIDRNMQFVLNDQLPENAPAFFFVDIQSDQLESFRETVLSEDGTEDLTTAPMLRGVITRLNGVPADEAVIDPNGAWVLRGDRGVTYSASPPPGTVVMEGDWWDADYSGPPLVSFAEEEGRELGLSIGSTLTVNILGRPLQVEVASFRKVEWRGMGINFLMVLSPGALAGAPHTHIATLFAEPRAEAPLLRRLGQEMPNITPILVRDQITRVSQGLERLGSATRWGALAVLLTGLAVLIGAAAAGEERRRAEAAILKVLGASRAAILGSFALRAALTGALAASVALLWGTLAAFGVVTFVFESDYILPITSTLAILLAGTGISLLAGLAFALSPLNGKPARVLRAAAG
ncbi:MAG: FtsX-like permease family protein [Pseudomonadota bacterium]